METAHGRHQQGSPEGSPIGEAEAGEGQQQTQGLSGVVRGQPRRVSGLAEDRFQSLRLENSPAGTFSVYCPFFIPWYTPFCSSHLAKRVSTPA